LLHEGNAHAAGREHGDGGGAARAQRRDLGLEIRHAELEQALAGELSLVDALEAAHDVLPGLIVRCQQIDVVDLLLVQDLRRRLGDLIGLPGEGEEIGAAFLAGEL
jgi:hypothetical protein